MTKSEMRCLQFQRKYASNEDYEKDKAYLVGLLESGYDFSSRRLKFIDLLKQSKWKNEVEVSSTPAVGLGLVAHNGQVEKTKG